MVKALSLRTTQIQFYIFNYLFRLKKNLNLDLLHVFLPCWSIFFHIIFYFIDLYCHSLPFWGGGETGTLAGELI